MIDQLQEIIKASWEIFDFYPESEVPETIGQNTSFSYPDYNILNRGGTYPWESEISTEKGHFDTLESEIIKAFKCDQTALKFLGVLSGMDYYRFISCMKWFCKKCGVKGGRIHKKRLQGILKRLSHALDRIAIRQFIFTIPMAWRSKFKNRAAINSLITMVEKIIKEKYPENPCIAYFHAFGEKNKGVYNPHVNVHVIEEKITVLRVPEEELQELRQKFRKALVGFGCRGNERMNIWYQFYEQKIKVMHKLSYMSRPCPGYEDFSFVRRDLELSNLFILEMKGFCYIRYFNGFAYCKQKDVDREQEAIDAVKVAGEPLHLVKEGTISRLEFDIKYRAQDYEKLSDGFYRILSIPKRN
jgi:hypothetical protein